MAEMNRGSSRTRANEYLETILKDLRSLGCRNRKRKVEQLREITTSVACETTRLLIAIVFSSHAVSLLQWLRSLTHNEVYGKIASKMLGLLDMATRGRPDLAYRRRKNRVDEKGRAFVEIVSNYTGHIERLLRKTIKGIAAMVRTLRNGEELIPIELEMVMETAEKLVKRLRIAKNSTHELKSVSESDMKTMYCSEDVEAEIVTRWRGVWSTKKGNRRK